MNLNERGCSTLSSLMTSSFALLFVQQCLILIQQQQDWLKTIILNVYSMLMILQNVKNSYSNKNSSQCRRFCQRKKENGQVQFMINVEPSWQCKRQYYTCEEVNLCFCLFFLLFNCCSQKIAFTAENTEILLQSYFFWSKWLISSASLEVRAQSGVTFLK